MFGKTEVDKLFEKINKADYLFYGSLIVISALVFAIPYGLEPVLMADSPAYLAGTLNQGIVPVYPLFISLNKLIFSPVYYLQAIVIEQVVLAVCVTVGFVLFIRKAMGAGRGETYLFLLLALIPYTVLMPDGMTSRFIVTEALAYPLFYLLMVSVLKGIWENKVSRVLFAEFFAIVMALTRTQLQLALLIPAGAFFILWVRGKIGNGNMQRISRVITGILLCSVIFVLSYGVYRQGNLILQRVLAWTVSAADGQREHEKRQGSVGEIESEVNKEEQTEGSVHVETNQNVSTQYSTVVFAKVMIMAEEEDADLFEDNKLQQLYTYVYDRLEQDQLVLSAMDKNLMIGDQLQIGLADISKSVNEFLSDYISQHPDSEINVNEARNEFLTVLLKAHPFRWIISGILQFPFGLISSVFVHRRNMYWISYLATAVIYVLAVGLCIVRFRDTRRRDFMAVCIGVNLLFVIATSMVFMSLKRYVNYGFGMFYISFYFLVKECIVDFIKEKQDNKK